MVSRLSSYLITDLCPIKVYETTGIRPSYKHGHISDNIVRGVKRKSEYCSICLVCLWTDSTIKVNNHHKALTTQDAKIESTNKKLRAAQVAIDRAEARVAAAHKRTGVNPDSEKFRDDFEQAEKSRVNAGNTYSKALDVSIGTIGMGSGHIMVLLPPHVANNAERK